MVCDVLEGSGTFSSVLKVSLSARHTQCLCTLFPDLECPSQSPSKPQFQILLSEETSYPLPTAVCVPRTHIHSPTPHMALAFGCSLLQGSSMLTRWRMSLAPYTEACSIPLSQQNTSIFQNTSLMCSGPPRVWLHEACPGQLSGNTFNTQQKDPLWLQRL